MSEQRHLYEDAPDPKGYAALAPDRPKSRSAAPYRVVQLSAQPVKRNLVTLFVIGQEPDQYEGTIQDPVPAKHYAQMLLDATELGVTMAEARMLHNVLGRENMRRLAECDALEPDDLIKIMEQVAVRARGPYDEYLGKAQSS